MAFFINGALTALSVVSVLTDIQVSFESRTVTIVQPIKWQVTTKAASAWYLDIAIPSDP